MELPIDVDGSKFIVNDFRDKESINNLNKKLIIQRTLLGINISILSYATNGYNYCYADIDSNVYEEIKSCYEKLGFTVRKFNIIDGSICCSIRWTEDMLC